MKRFLFLLLILTLVFCIGCGRTPDNTEGNEGNEGSSYKDPTHKSGTYKIIFKMGPQSIVHYYEKGEMPEPPVFEDYVMDTITIRHTGEWEEEFTPVDGDKTYRAKYEQITNSCIITFVTREGSVDVNVPIRSMPKIPEVKDYNGMKFVGFDKPVTLATEDTTYTALYSNIYSGETMLDLLNFSLVAYPSSVHDTDDRNGIHDSCFALYALVHHEHEMPQDGAISRRIVEHLENIVAPGNAPSFDLWTNWSYSVMTASIALAKDTPTVWSKTTADVRARLNTMMECYAYIESLGTSDENSFKTGPGFYGNFAKTWNPNYRLGNVGVMVFVTHYFGNGNIEAGAAAVNEMLNGFDEAKFDEVVQRFIKYGWVRATNVWLNEGRTDASNKGDSAKDLLVWGTREGRKYVSYNKGDANNLTTSTGEGVGVNNNGKPYKYNGNPLERVDLILMDLIAHNYSGGVVKNQHYSDLNGDGVLDLVGGLANPEASSPYLGQDGMMLEFATSNRSSASYCRGDFLLTGALMSAGVALNIVDVKENDATWQKMIVGNEDFLYKYKMGYSSYSEGSYGTSSHTDYESSYKGKQYYAIKELWAWMKTTY